MTTSEIKMGKLISSQEGRCRGPRFGEVYTAALGGKGFLAGYRSSASLGLGLMGVKEFATKKAALDYSVQVSDD